MGGVIRPVLPRNALADALLRLRDWAHTPDRSPLAPLTEAIQTSETFAPGGVNRPALNPSHPRDWAPTPALPSPAVMRAPRPRQSFAEALTEVGGPPPVPGALTPEQNLAASGGTTGTAPTYNPALLKADAAAREAAQRATAATIESLRSEHLTPETQRAGLAGFDRAIASAATPEEAAALGQRKMQYLAQTHRQLELGHFGRSAADALLLGAVNAPIYRDLKALAESGRAVTPEELKGLGVVDPRGKPAALERGGPQAMVEDLAAGMAGGLPYYAVGVGAGRAAAGMAGRALGAESELGGLLRQYAVSQPTGPTALGRTFERALLEAPQGVGTGAALSAVSAAQRGDSPLEAAAEGVITGPMFGALFGAGSQAATEGLWGAIRSGLIRPGSRAGRAILRGSDLGGLNPLVRRDWLDERIHEREAGTGMTRLLGPEERLPLVTPPPGAPAADRGAAGRAGRAVGTVQTPSGATVRLLQPDHAYDAPAGTQIKRGIRTLWEDLRQRMSGGGTFEPAPEGEVTPFRRALGYDREGPGTRVERKRYGQVVTELARRASRALGRAVDVGEVRGALAQEVANAPVKTAGKAAGAVALALLGQQSDDERVQAAALVPFFGIVRHEHGVARNELGPREVRPGERVHDQPFVSAAEAGRFARDYGDFAGDKGLVKVRPVGDGTYEVVLKGESVKPAPKAKPEPASPGGLRPPDEPFFQSQVKDDALAVLESGNGGGDYYAGEAEVPSRTAAEWAKFVDNAPYVAPGAGTDAFRGLDPATVLTREEARAHVEGRPVGDFTSRPEAGDNGFHSRLEHFLTRLPQQTATGKDWLQFLKGGEAHNFAFEEVEATLEHALRQHPDQRFSTPEIQDLWRSVATTEEMHPGSAGSVYAETLGSPGKAVERRVESTVHAERKAAQAEYGRARQRLGEAVDRARGEAHDVIERLVSQAFEEEGRATEGHLSPELARFMLRQTMNNGNTLDYLMNTGWAFDERAPRTEEVGDTLAFIRRHYREAEAVFKAHADAVRAEWTLEQDGDPFDDRTRWNKRRAELRKSLAAADAQRATGEAPLDGPATSFAGAQRDDANARALETLVYLTKHNKESADPVEGDAHYAGDQGKPGVLTWGRTEDVDAEPGDAADFATRVADKLAAAVDQYRQAGYSTVGEDVQYYVYSDPDQWGLPRADDPAWYAVPDSPLSRTRERTIDRIATQEGLDRSEAEALVRADPAKYGLPPEGSPTQAGGPPGSRRVIELQSNWGPTVRDEGGRRARALTPEEHTAVAADVQRLYAEYERLLGQHGRQMRSSRTANALAEAAVRAKEEAGAALYRANERSFKVTGGTQGRRHAQFLDKVAYLERVLGEHERQVAAGESPRRRADDIAEKRRLLKGLLKPQDVERGRRRAKIAEKKAYALAEAWVKLDESSRANQRRHVAEAVEGREHALARDKGRVMREYNAAVARTRGVENSDAEYPWMPWYRTQRHIGLALAAVVKRAVDDGRAGVYVVSPENRSHLKRPAAEHIYGKVAPEWMARLVETLRLPTQVERIADRRAGTGVYLPFNDATIRILKRTGLPALGLLLAAQSDDKEDAKYLRAMAFVAIGGVEGEFKPGDVLRGGFENGKAAGAFARELAAAGLKGEVRRGEGGFDVIFKGEVTPTEPPGTAVAVRDQMAVAPLDWGQPLEAQRPAPGSPGRVLQPDVQGRFTSRLGQTLEALPEGKAFTAAEWLQRLPAMSTFARKEFDAVLRPTLETMAAEEPTRRVPPSSLLWVAEQNQFKVTTHRLGEGGVEPARTRAVVQDPGTGTDPVGYRQARFEYDNPAQSAAHQEAIDDAQRSVNHYEQEQRRYADSITEEGVTLGVSHSDMQNILNEVEMAAAEDRSWDSARVQEIFLDSLSVDETLLHDELTADLRRKLDGDYRLARGQAEHDAAHARLTELDQRSRIEALDWVARQQGDPPLLPEGYTVEQGYISTRETPENYVWMVLDKDGEVLANAHDRERALEAASSDYLNDGEGEDAFSEWRDQKVDAAWDSISQDLNWYAEATAAYIEADNHRYFLEEDNDTSDEDLRRQYDLEEPDLWSYSLREGGEGEHPDALYSTMNRDDSGHRLGDMVYDEHGNYVTPGDARTRRAAAEATPEQLNLLGAPDADAVTVEPGAPGEQVVRFEPTEGVSLPAKWKSHSLKELTNYREILTTMAQNPLDEQKFTAGHYYTSPADVHHMARMGEVSANLMVTSEGQGGQPTSRTLGDIVGLEDGERALLLDEAQGDPANDLGEKWQSKDRNKANYTSDPTKAGTVVRGMRKRTGRQIALTPEQVAESRSVLAGIEDEVQEVQSRFHERVQELGTSDLAVIAGDAEVLRLNGELRDVRMKEVYHQNIVDTADRGHRQTIPEYENEKGVTGTFVDSQQEVASLGASRLLQEAAEGGHRVIMWNSADDLVERWSEAHRGLYTLIYDQSFKAQLEAKLRVLGFDPKTDVTWGRLNGTPTGDHLGRQWWARLPEGFDAAVVRKGLSLMGMTGLLALAGADDADAQTADGTKAAGMGLGTKLAVGAGIAGAVGGTWLLGRALHLARLERHRPLLGESPHPTLRGLATGREGTARTARSLRGPLPRLTDNAIERLGLTPDLAKEMAGQMQGEIARRGKAPKVSWEETRAKAAAKLNVHPETLANLDPTRVTGDEVLALASLASDRAKQAAAVTERLKAPGLTVEERERLQNEMDGLDRDFQTFMSGAMKGASEQGRSLNAAKILANVHADPEAWVYRAQRVLGPNQSLTLDQAIKVRELAHAKDTEGLIQYLAGLRRTSIPDQIVTILNAGLFTRPAARVLDLAGGMGALFAAHGPLAYPKAALDYLIGKALLRGARSATAPAFWRTKQVAYGASEGWRETKRFMGVQAWKEGGIRGWVEHIRAADVTPEMVSRYDIPHLTTIDMLSLARDPNTPANKAVDLVQKAVYRSLSMSDRVIVGAGYEGFLADLAMAQALTEKHPRPTERAKELAGAPTDELRAQALYLAHELTFQNEGAASAVSRAVAKAPGQAMRALSTKLGMGAPGEFASSLVDAAVRYQFPVVKTAANITARVTDYTPIGAVRGMYNIVQAVLADRAGNDPKRLASQRKAVDALTRAGAGVGLLALGAYLEEQGLATGAAPVDSQEREEWRAEGKRPNSILYKGKWRPLGRIAAGGTVMSVGATMNQLRKAKAKGKSTFGAVVPAIGRTILDQPLLTGTRTALDALRDPVGMGERYTEGLAARAVPTAVGMGVSALNGSEYKDVHGPVEAIQARLDPEGKLGLWKRLPSQRTAYGDPVRGVEGFARGLLDPFAGPTDARTRDPLLAKLDEIGFRPRGTKSGKEESPLQYEAHMKAQGSLVRDALTKMIQSPRFQQAPEIAARLLQRNPTMVVKLADQFELPGTSIPEVTRLVQLDMLTDAENEARARMKSQLGELLVGTPK